MELDKIYIVYENDDIWGICYKSFEAALFHVYKKVEKINEDYKKTPDFEIEPLPPAKMEDDYNKKDVEKGILVANVFDYDINIRIKEICIF
jgi:hypothetical protein